MSVLKRLPEFVTAVTRQFWRDRPECYQDYCYYLSCKIEDVKLGKTTEDEIIDEKVTLPDEV